MPSNLHEGAIQTRGGLANGGGLVHLQGAPSLMEKA